MRSDSPIATYFEWSNFGSSGALEPSGTEVSVGGSVHTPNGWSLVSFGLALISDRPASLNPAFSAAATFERINAWYYSDAPKTVRPQLDLARRTGSFDEVQGGLTEDNALFEARRCLSCGNCFECDNCYGVCPDNAVIKLGAGQRFRIDLDYCKGCGVCAAECPCGAIEMVAEEV